jgi:HK97 family phage major capsid protein
VFSRRIFTEMNPVLVAAKQRRNKSQKQLNQLVTAAEMGRRSLSTAEEQQFERLATSIKADGREIKRLKAEEKRKNIAAAAALHTERGGARFGAYVTREAMTYGPSIYGEKRSYFLDIATVSAGGQAYGDREEASARLHQHAKEVEIEARSDRDLEARLYEMRMTPASLEARVNPNTTAGTGGEFVPPLWLVSQYVPLARAGRVCANRVQNLPLPPGTDSINIPKINGGALVAVQSANAAPVASQDITTKTVTAPVNTLAGQQDISMQLLEQSPLSMDGVIFQDLMRDYDRTLDQQVLYGSGSNGQHQGVLTQTNQTSNTDILKANAFTCSSTVFHDASTSGTQYRSIANGAVTIETLRYESPTAIWCHPRRVTSWNFASDTTGRPMFVGPGYGPFNAQGTAAYSTNAQGYAGELYGLPVIKDANIPTTCVTGAVTGGTGDVIAVVKEDDLVLYEGVVRLRALPEILSGTLQMRFQLYCYSAFFPNRFPPSTSIITGTSGLAAPGF